MGMRGAVNKAADLTSGKLQNTDDDRGAVTNRATDTRRGLMAAYAELWIDARTRNAEWQLGRCGDVLRRTITA